jgi:non-specific serine/threonine protein kinase/serine/threonine-protein kinase
VALKVIKPGLDSRPVLARFEAERQALALMDHPHIARVLDAGTTPEGRPYFVMELIRGEPITRFCDDNHLTPRERLELFVPVCQAVQHAHQKGVIHRDLKPSNVLVTLADGRPVPKVIDFGVAKALHQQLTERTMVTEFGQVVGTLEYMAPEQAGLSHLDVDTRADVYALGALLYELLTGATPFDRQRLHQAALDEVLHILREEEPPRPSTRLSSSEALPAIAAQRRTEPAQLSRLVRGELDWIVMKALEKDRARRYETANGLARDLQRYLADEPVEAGPPSAAYRLRKFVRRNKAPVATAAAILLLLVAGVVGTSFGLVQALAARRAEAAQRSRAEAEAAVAQAVNEFLNRDLLAQASPDRQPDRDLKLRTVLDRAAKQVAGRFDRQPLVEAAIRRTIGETYHELGESTAAQQHLERALSLYRRELGDEHADTLAAMCSLGDAYQAHGAYDRAKPLLDQALETRRRIHGEGHAETLLAAQLMGLWFFLQDRHVQAEPYYTRVLEGRRRLLGEAHPDTLLAMINLGQLYVSLKRYPEAEDLLGKALQLGEALDPDHPRTLTARGALGSLYRLQRQYDRAEPLVTKSMEDAVRVLGTEHRNTLTAMHNLALLYSSQGKLEQAGLLNGALEGLRRKLGPVHLDTLKSLAEVYRVQGRADRAESLLRQVLEGWRNAPDGREHPSTLETMSFLALLYRDHGKPDQAEPLYAEVLTGYRRQYGPSSLAVIGPLASLGDTLLQQRKYAEAEPLLRECLAICEQKLPNSVLRFRAQGLLGASLAGQQKYAEAEPLLLGAYAGLRPGGSRWPGWVQEAFDRVVRFYKDWGQPEKAAAWRAERLAEWDRELRDSGFIRDWLVLAPLPLPGPPTTILVDQDPTGGEAGLRPRAGEMVMAGGREFIWAEHRAEQFFLDFNSVVGQMTPRSIAYAVCYVVADEERHDFRIKLDSDDQAKVYLNGREVYRYGRVRSLVKDRDTVANVTLNKGTNVLVFKVVNLGGDWQGCLRFVNKDGRPAQGIAVRLEP